jgi:hypothetical protein
VLAWAAPAHIATACSAMSAAGGRASQTAVSMAIDQSRLAGRPDGILAIR